MGSSQRLLDLFPSFMRAEQPGKALGSVTFALGGQLDEAERLANNIQKAHRIAVADEERDIVQLASLLGLQLVDFFILRTFFFFNYTATTEKDVSVAFKGGATEFVF